MTPFVIVADLRTGSTLLSSSLDQHPQVRCYGELFHPRDLPDNRIDGQNRYDRSGRELVRRVFGTPGVRAAGFRAMIFLPLEIHPQWADSWDSLREVRDLRVIYLERENRLAQYASAQIAHATGVYHPAPADPILEGENRPEIEVDPEELRRWIGDREALFEQCRSVLDDKPALELTYERMVGDWDGVIRSVQRFLHVDPVPVSPAKQKQERRPLEEVIANYEDVAAFAG